MCHCGAEVKEFLARVDKPCSTPGDAAFSFFVPFLFFLSIFVFNTITPFGLFFFTLTADPAGHALGSIYILILSPEIVFLEKGFQKLLICILTKLTTS